MRSVPSPQPWIFAELCPGCQQPITAAFCHESTCRRKFVLLPDRSRAFCPLHDRATRAEVRDRQMRQALHCPNCNGNVYGVKRED